MENQREFTPRVQQLALEDTQSQTDDSPETKFRRIEREIKDLQNQNEAMRRDNKMLEEEILSLDVAHEEEPLQSMEEEHRLLQQELDQAYEALDNNHFDYGAEVKLRTFDSRPPATKRARKLRNKLKRHMGAMMAEKRRKLEEDGEQE